MQKKRHFFDLKKQNFSKSTKSHFFKGDNPCFPSKNANYLVCLDLVKIRVEITLSDLTEKKNLFLLQTTEFFKVEIITFFPKGLIQAFDQKMPNSSLFRFSQKT